MMIHSDAAADGRTGVVNFYTILHNKRLLTDFCQRRKAFTFILESVILAAEKVASFLMDKHGK